MREEKGRLLIGDLAERAGVNRETVRYYERRGLLKPGYRTSSGYRVYDERAAERLGFIKRAQGFGLSLQEIGELLDLRPESPRSCDRVMRMLDRKLGEIGRSIDEMKRFYDQLARYRADCNRALASGEACPLILDAGRGPQKKEPGRLNRQSGKGRVP
jgi:DNA-binding transcriptional MerR regulator